MMLRKYMTGFGLGIQMLTNSVAANDAIINIDLAKTPLSQQRWLDKEVSTVLNPEDIKKVILLKAITNPEAIIDSHHIVRLLKSKAYFEKGRIPDVADWIWDAVIVTSDGELFRLMANIEWFYLVNEQGYGIARTGMDSSAEAALSATVIRKQWLQWYDAAHKTKQLDEVNVLIDNLPDSSMFPQKTSLHGLLKYEQKNNWQRVWRQSKSTGNKVFYWKMFLPGDIGTFYVVSFSDSGTVTGVWHIPKQ